MHQIGGKPNKQHGSRIGRSDSASRSGATRDSRLVLSPAQHQKIAVRRNPLVQEVHDRLDAPDVKNTRARARPWSARCYGVARQRDRSRQTSTGVSGALLSGISGSRVVPKNLARRILIYWFRRRDAARGDRAGWAVPRRRSYDLLVSAAPR
jgi:hypothetical protein